LAAQIADEGLVYFDFIEWELLEVVQGGISGSKVVQ
jgi:hypothetical protein